MAEMSLEEVPKPVRDLFNKGFSAFERENLDYAIDMLFACIEREPGFLRARKFLRAAEIQRFKQKKSNFLTRGLSSMTGSSAVLGIKAMRSQNPEKAVLAAEKMLKSDPLNSKLILAFAESAVAAGLPEAAIQTLEIARDHIPDDILILNMLGQTYAGSGQTKKARQCFEKVCELAPDDPDAMKLLKDAMATDSSSSYYEAAKEGDYRDLIKDSNQATLLEQQDKAVKTDKDVDALITDILEKIAAEPANVNYYRTLAKLYAQRNDYDSGISILGKALEINPGDPELDGALSKLYIQKYDYTVNQLRSAGDEDGALGVENERLHYLFNNLQDRVTRYPNDLELRYDWGVMLYKNDYFPEAIQQFQLSQRNPKRRIQSLYYLGMCFKQRKQYDMAKDQLQMALSEMPTMTEEKKDVIYELAILAEAAGDRDTAAGLYKQIYQVDISYKDISQKIEGFYQQ